ncbi:hypothetical protein [Methylobacterium sp. NEAU K]|uniref:hypothetical protein n=1 Tax=Methylobacterium sp. NEAU K TaxID=3064946 RepID=UPI002736770F|nr:hypothetical protein [Methylobacterium sp. NEAU K]MDP4005049.1 hypothetical protein [Methylobacterium sp. NEAU K]
MSDEKSRRVRRPAVSRKGLDLIAEGVAARVPPPVTPGLGEGLLSRARNPRTAFAMPPGHDGADTNPEMRILIALARIEERQTSLVEANKSAQTAAEARHTNVMQAIATFVPRSEIDKDNRAIHERIDAVAERIGAMDKRIWTALIGAVGAFGVVVLTKVGLMH